MNDENITRDVVNGVKALEIAVDALARIGELGGVQGDWAMDALREVNGLMVGRPRIGVVTHNLEAVLADDRPALRVVEGSGQR
jgi:hypothetical protein